ncbi:HYR domain-containing protein [Antarcticibacterium sp. 1MA-6-2]|uniref:HYR domain-containing protein n=1 Tax=Antarcticibacterium sp. 1MA-6-2 TaxID=2908210 RepID=UPI001F29450E|nr:HYR domain-containing protein [Antarcticibacterium sp. 1MA-6-2]UJH91193.1 HYR domain-containing protein [Antarcticibacterium sp. 1MA-6-2]
MSGITTCHTTSQYTIPAATRQGKWFLIFLLVLFYSFPSEVVGQEPADVPPVYKWIGGKDLALVKPTIKLIPFSVTVNSKDIIIAVATDPQGNVYNLSFGGGVSKYNSNGNLIKTGFIPSSALESPLDMAIDEEGYIYIADFFAGGTTYTDNGKIRIFDSLGNPLPERTIFTSYFRPMGIDVDEENIYVAEYNDGKKGPESNPSSRIEIYKKTERIPRATTSQVEIPYRIAVDSKQNIFVSQTGNNNPEVLIFNSTLTTRTILSNIESPGSVVVDDFDFLHVVDYHDKVNFNDFIAYENLDYNAILSLYNKIKEGISHNVFSIKIFNKDNILVKTLRDNNSNEFNIEFPIDLTFNGCDRMYTINVNTTNDLGLDFDLEIYKRTPSFDQEKPVITCPANIEETLTVYQNSVAVNFANPTVTDNCSFTVTQTKGDPSGSQFSVGTHVIEFTATDTSGNKNTCSFTIKIDPAEEEPDTEDPVLTCPSNITRNVDPGTCGAVVTYTTPTATDNSGNASVTLKEGIVSGGTFPVGTTTVTYEAVDAAGNRDECSFTVTVKDNEKPTITCSADITVTAPIIC